METDKSSSILDWLESVPTDANSLLILGLAGPPRLSQLFPTCSSPVSHAVLSTAQRKGWRIIFLMTNSSMLRHKRWKHARTVEKLLPFPVRAVSSNGIKIFETLRSMEFQNNPVLTTHLQLTAIAYKISRSKNFKTPPAYADSFGKNFPFSIVYSLSSSKDENNSTSRPEVSTRSTRFTCIFLIFYQHSDKSALQSVTRYIPLCTPQ